MQQSHGDLWIADSSRQTIDAIVITTNGAVKSNGAVVMGRGCAQQARDRFLGLDKRIGAHVTEFGNVCGVFDVGKAWQLVTMPVKHHWREQADLDLILASARALHELANTRGWKYVRMPRPGCGNGRLSWEQVGPLLDEVLDDRFEVVTYPPRMVLNRHRDDCSHAIYVGRPTMWGNPFHLRAGISRERAIESYRQWLWHAIEDPDHPITVERLAALHGRPLACWCAPEPCHADVLVRAAAWAASQ